MPDPNGSVIAELDARRPGPTSVKIEDYDKDNPLGSSVIYFLLPAYGPGGIQALPPTLPARRSGWQTFSDRDQVLLSTPYYEAMWADALGIAVSKMASIAWEIESDVPLRRKRAQQVLLNSSAGIFVGWVPFISAHLRSFLCCGFAVAEIERESRAYGSRIRALRHLNPLRCVLTNDPENPVIYHSRLTNKHHLLKWWQCLLLGDMIDPTEGELAMIFSAAERTYLAITELAAIERYVYEKVSGKRALALHFINGVTATHLNDAIASAHSEQARKGLATYMGAAVIPVPGDVPVQLVTVPLAELPDGFDPEKERTNGYLKYANAIGLDPQDLQPLTGQPLGTGTQSAVLHEKAKGRGLVAWRQQWTHANNSILLDDEITKFIFTERDLEDEKRRADLRKVNTDTDAVLIDKGIIQPEEARNLAVDRDELPREFLVEDKTASDSLSDTDKPQEADDSGGAENQDNQAEQPQAAEPEQATKKHLAGRHDEKKHGNRGDFTESVRAIRAAKTGQPVTATLYRGSGSTDPQRSRIPSQYGEGQYWSARPEVAQTYGPSVKDQQITLRNPYIFDLPGKKPYYEELRAEFGTRKPAEITSKLVAQGYDSLVVRNVPVTRGGLYVPSSEEIILFEAQAGKALSANELDTLLEQELGAARQIYQDVKEEA